MEKKCFTCNGKCDETIRYDFYDNGNMHTNNKITERL